MGIYDSSRTRVAPVFGHLQCLDPSGKLWLQGLLELANTRKMPTPQAGTARLRVAKWWPREARLAAPPALLRWLLENAEEPRDAAAWGRRPEVMANRRRVVDRDADTLAGALQSLQDRRPSPRAWYVLEGPEPAGRLSRYRRGGDRGRGQADGDRADDVHAPGCACATRCSGTSMPPGSTGGAGGSTGSTSSRRGKGPPPSRPRPHGTRRSSGRSPRRCSKAACRTGRRTSEPRSPVRCSASPPGRPYATSSRFLAPFSSPRYSMTGQCREAPAGIGEVIAACPAAW